MGSDEGGTVPDAEEPIISRRDSAVLRMAAERTGGIYIDGSRKDAAALLTDQLRSLAPETETRGSRREQKARWFPFLAAALLAYGASKISQVTKRGKGRISKGLASLFVCLFFASCTQASGKLLIMEANFLASRGLYTEAASYYLKALEYEEAAPYAEYGLGSVYYSLDEAKAALDRFGDSQEILESRSPGEHRELRYRNNYNTGVVLFGEGNFSGAAGAFKEALKTDPGRIEAKRNLELSLLSLAREHAGEGQAEREQTESESRLALFEYLRQKEQNQWKSREWGAEEQDSGPDY
jgi:Ca-activated chloride channel family protein